MRQKQKKNTKTQKQNSPHKNDEKNNNKGQKQAGGSRKINQNKMQVKYFKIKEKVGKYLLLCALVDYSYIHIYVSVHTHIHSYKHIHMYKHTGVHF